MTEKKKRTLIVLGSLVVCAGLVWAITAQFSRPANVDDTTAKSAAAHSAEPEEITAEPASTPDIVINTKTPQDTETPAETTEPIPEQTDKTEQIIQADPVKPTEEPDFTPTQEQLDSGEVPSGDDEVTATPTMDAPTSTPSGGTEGQIYVPGFGWVEDEGDNRGGIAEDMYENGNKVGTMD